jgi:hypothetical protein
MRLRRIESGLYELEDGSARIVRTEWDGPRGGTRKLWEWMAPDRWVGWVIDDRAGYPSRTLREAREQAAQR